MKKTIKIILSIVSVAAGLFCITGVIVFASEKDWDSASGVGIIALLLLIAPFWKRLRARMTKLRVPLQKILPDKDVPEVEIPSTPSDTVMYPWEEDPETAGLLRRKKETDAGQERDEKSEEVTRIEL